MALNDESSSKPEFKFRNVNLSLKDNHILRNVSGIVQRGEILAVLGPKGKKTGVFWQESILTLIP